MSVGYRKPTAIEISFEPQREGSSLVSDNLQDALEEANGTTPVRYQPSGAEQSTCSSIPYTVDNSQWTPPAGTYLVTFSGRGNVEGDYPGGEFGIQVDGAFDGVSIRELSGQYKVGAPLFTQSVVTVDGTQVVSVAFKSINGSVFTITTKSTTFMRIA